MLNRTFSHNEPFYLRNITVSSDWINYGTCTDKWPTLDSYLQFLLLDYFILFYERISNYVCMYVCMFSNIFITVLFQNFSYFIFLASAQSLLWKSMEIDCVWSGQNQDRKRNIALFSLSIKVNIKKLKISLTENVTIFSM